MDTKFDPKEGIFCTQPATDRAFTVLNMFFKINNLKLDSILQKLKSGKYELVLQKKKRKKSLTANAYMWVLCEEIAKVVRTTKEEVYKRAIWNVGVYEDGLACKDFAWSQWCKKWESMGVGYFLREISRKNGWVKYWAYYGSSVYTAEELSRLIDELVYEAEGIGIDVLSSRERRQLIMKWGETHGNSKGRAD